jgi:tRNA threonylcarbamoyladenosine biosynthesis protein TsaB
MSFILGIDTSSIELGIGLANEQQSILSVSRYLRNSHAEHISQTIKFLLETSGIQPSDISHIAIAVGPGSFTGLRIGISFLKGFCFAREVKVLPVSSLESMASAFPFAEKPVVAAFDARNGEVFWARFEPKENALERTHEDRLTPIAEMMNSLQENDAIITDTLGYAKSTVFGILDNRPTVHAVERTPIQRGLACARIGMRRLSDEGLWVSASEILPRYLNTTTMEKRLTGKV